MATRKTYSKAFKIQAVRLLGLGDKPASQLAHGSWSSIRLGFAPYNDPGGFIKCGR